MAHTLSNPVVATRHATDILLAPFRAIGRFFILVMENNSRVQMVERLNAKSDAELAEIGLKRDEIVHHVFRDLYYL
ncbi:hypothetical protein [Aliiroseovarius sp.]|uniref:hypothetical protein n=1 Tax=Aliiroseovarius sp. TaxID=1872442 RepID=UPI002634BE0E|nr:hypothetical protein [Aliiroseovarius sp.]